MLLLVLIVFTMPALGQTAPAGEDVAPVVDQLEGIRVELKAISRYLQLLEEHQQVTLLMTRIRLKQQRLSLLESRVQSARNEQQYIEEEIEQLQTVEQSYFEDVERDEFGTEESEARQQELSYLRQQKRNLQSRLEAQRARVIELENDLMQAREDVLALEEAVDERLGLR
jgi:chromosome segregation ATPase